ncbi:hypothetical protein OQA88_7426 [Cercophora sp. LCS_1]
MPTIHDIYKAIKETDVDPSHFEGLSYGITYNDRLGLPKGGDFLVVSPFGKLPADDAAFARASDQYDEGKMPIQEAFKDVLIKGNDLSADQTTLFIDIADLDDDNGNTVFLTEGGADSIAETIAGLVNELEKSRPGVTPVIRFLRGASGKVSVDDAFWNSHRPGIEAMFWKTDDSGKELVPRITHPNAQFHIGYYSPNFVMTPKEESGLKLASLMFGLAKGWSFDVVNTTVDTAFKTLTFSASWNHGKIVAIGGKTIMTGGINYWPDYIGKKGDGRGRIIDMQATVTGDAAASAQGGYLDYFWKYLNLKATDRRTDLRCFKRSITLNSKAKVGELPWQADKDVPIFKDLAKYHPKAPGTGIPVLSVARVGDWGGDVIAAYPVQGVDGLRDIFVNKAVPILEAEGNFSGILDKIHEFSDSGSYAGVLRTFGFSPAVWASDTARIWAIGNAQSTVYTSGQMLVGALQRGVGAYDAMVAATNKTRPPAHHWDGYLWSYELLRAFATVILRLRDNKADHAESGIYIVLGNNDPNNKRSGEWGDARSVGDVQARIVSLLRGLDAKLDEASASKLVGEYFHIRRIEKPYGKDGPDSIHTKTICVDRELLYVGSDNLYPSYNEEHGIWVDDKPAVAGWISDYWDVLWKKATGPTALDVKVSTK